MRFVYISAPYTKPDPAENTRIAIAAADPLLKLGYAPYIPHLSHFWHLQTPHPYEDWMELDLAWISRCDALIRLPGESPGADQEVLFAEQLGINVYYGVEEFLEQADWLTLDG